MESEKDRYQRHGSACSNSSFSFTHEAVRHSPPHRPFQTRAVTSSPRRLDSRSPNHPTTLGTGRSSGAASLNTTTSSTPGALLLLNDPTPPLEPLPATRGRSDSRASMSKSATPDVDYEGPLDGTARDLDTSLDAPTRRLSSAFEGSDDGGEDEEGPTMVEEQLPSSKIPVAAVVAPIADVPRRLSAFDGIAPLGQTPDGYRVFVERTTYSRTPEGDVVKDVCRWSYVSDDAAAIAVARPRLSSPPTTVRHRAGRTAPVVPAAKALNQRPATSGPRRRPYVSPALARRVASDGSDSDGFELVAEQLPQHRIPVTTAPIEFTRKAPHALDAFGRSAHRRARAGRSTAQSASLWKSPAVGKPAGKPTIPRPFLAQSTSSESESSDDSASSGDHEAVAK